MAGLFLGQEYFWSLVITVKQPAQSPRNQPRNPTRGLKKLFVFLLLASVQLTLWELKLSDQLLPLLPVCVHS